MHDSTGGTSAPMSRFGRSIAGLMVAVGCIAAGFAALKNPSPFIGAIAHNVAFVSLALAVVCSVVGRGTLRILATGFAAFAWSYYLFNLSALRTYNKFNWVQGRPTLLIEHGFVLLERYLLPTNRTAYDSVCQPLAILLTGFVGAGVSVLIAAWSDRHQANAELTPDEDVTRGRT